MATETVLDYLGHPCQIAEAFDRFEESVENARKLEPRALVRQIGIQLNALNDRNEHSSNALRLARDSLNNSDDAEKVQSLLALAFPFDVESCIRLHSLAGLVLVALEHGNLLEARMDKTTKGAQKLLARSKEAALSAAWKHDADFDFETASLALGMAWGVASMCCSHAENDEADFTHVRAALRHIASLAEEAECATPPGAVREAVNAARAVSQMLLSGVATEALGSVGMHWNAEITNWALHALCDVIEKAKSAVDGQDVEVMEASHG